MLRRKLLSISIGVGVMATLGFIEANDIVPAVPDEPKVAKRVDLPAKSFAEKLEVTKIGPDGPGETLHATFDMIYIPAGEFEMGSPAAEKGRRENEGPRHKVKVNAFWLAKVETTWELFDLWLRDANLPLRSQAEDVFEWNNSDRKLGPDAITRPSAQYVDDTYGHGRIGKPALSMSHHTAMIFCHWLRLNTKRGYRLPTEAEWEYACRAGSKGAYGFDESKGKLADFAWFRDNSKTEHLPEGTTHEVGKKKPNAFGLHDMHGNVAEWCLDQYDPKCYGEFAKKDLTLGAFTKPTEKRWSNVVRGGSWLDGAEKLRSSYRWPSDAKWNQKDPDFPSSVWWHTEMDMIGFRVALPVEEYPELVGLKPAVVKKGR